MIYIALKKIYIFSLLMSTGCFLPYVGLGSCLLHMPYIHQFAKKEGPVTILTFSKSLEDALKFVPNVKKIILVEEFHKKLSPR